MQHVDQIAAGEERVGENREEREYRGQHDEKAMLQQESGEPAEGLHAALMRNGAAETAASSSPRVAEPGICAVRRPRDITRYRSQMRISSSGSEEITSTAAPARASAAVSFRISDLAPTSSPRVGSSSRNRRGLVASQRPTTTFCWLPPLRVPTV